jgi:16S rRNA (uracil1498-N3)-methyltransferase
MRTPRLYVNQKLTENSVVVLEQQASHYLCKVLRVKAGRELVLFNGCLSDAGSSGEYRATLTEANKKAAVVALTNFTATQSESNLKLELACCLIKNDRMDWLLQKATELGVTSISPLFSEYTDVKLSAERVDKKQCHWQQIVISACEQSGRSQVPVVNSPIPISQWLTQDTSENKYVLHPYDAKPFVLDNKPRQDSLTVALLVGPEGGLSDAEVATAHVHQFKSIQLGPRILRAETAPLVALSIIQSQLGDFS